MKNTQLMQLLKHQQNRTSLTELEIGTKHGFSQQAFSSWKSGSLPRPKMYPGVASFLGINEDEVANLVAEAKISTGNTKIPFLGAPVLGRGESERISIDKYPSGYAKPEVEGTYAVKVAGKTMWVNPRIKPVEGNEVLIRNDGLGRTALWPTSTTDEDEVHVIVLRETL